MVSLQGEGQGLQNCHSHDLDGIKPLYFEAQVNFSLDTHLGICRLTGSIKILPAFLLPEHLQKPLNLYCSALNVIIHVTIPSEGVHHF